MIFCFKYKMNEIRNTFLLIGDKFMPEHNLDLIIVLVVHLLTTKKELKNFCKQEIQIIFTKMILIKLVFNMIWLMVNLQIWLKEHNQIKFYDINLLKLRVIQNMMDIKEDQLRWFKSFLLKNLLEFALKTKLHKNNNLQTNFINQSSENLKDAKLIHHWKTIFGV